MPTPIARIGFRLALPNAGLTVFRPGDTVNPLDFTVADLAVITAFGVANPGTLLVSGTAAIDAAVPAALAVRAAGGDPVGNFQATQNLFDAAYISDHP